MHSVMGLTAVLVKYNGTQLMCVGNSVKQNKKKIAGVNSVVYPWLDEKLCHFLLERKLCSQSVIGGEIASGGEKK